MIYINEYATSGDVQTALNEGTLLKPYLALVSGETIDYNELEPFIDYDVWVSIRALNEIFGNINSYPLGKELYMGYNDGNPDGILNTIFTKTANQTGKTTECIWSQTDRYGYAQIYYTTNGGAMQYNCNIQQLTQSEEDECYWWNGGLKNVGTKYLHPTARVYVQPWMSEDFNFYIASKNIDGQSISIDDYNQVYAKVKYSTIKDYISN